MRLFPALILTVFIAVEAFAQSTFPTNGAPFDPSSVYAFINANIQKDPETLITNGMMVVQKGRIISVSDKSAPPKDAIIYDLKGKYIYPSFIDLYSEYGLTQPSPPKRNDRAPQMESSVKGAYAWNQALKSEVRSYQQLVHNKEKAAELKKLGIGIVLSSVRDGIVRGSGVLLSLNSNKRENESVIVEEAAAFYSFSKGTSTQDYPTSLTGASALLRQTHYDARWYAQKPDGAEYNITLQEFNRLQSLPSVFDAGDKFNGLRASKLGAEIGINYIIKGSGNE